MKALALLLGIPALLLVYLYGPVLFRLVWLDSLMPVVVIGATALYAGVLIHAVVSGIRLRRKT